MSDAVAMAVAVALGPGAAVYLAEYATPQVRKTLKPTFEILADILSAVLGFFALSFISPQIVQRFLSDATGTDPPAQPVRGSEAVTPKCPRALARELKQRGFDALEVDASAVEIVKADNLKVRA